MKRYAKYVAMAALTVTMLSGAATAYAAGNAPQAGDTTQPAQAARPNPPPDGSMRRGGPRHGGLEGQVTAVASDSLTVLTRQDASVTVNITATTTVRLMLTDADGALSDVKVGSNVQIMGRPGDEGVIDAREIVVAPDGDKASGRVTSVDGAAITVETPDGALKIATTASTQFVSKAGEQAASLSDVAAGAMVTAYGKAGADGSLTATVVFIGGARGPDRGPRGAADAGAERPQPPAGDVN